VTEPYRGRHQMTYVRAQAVVTWAVYFRSDEVIQIKSEELWRANAKEKKVKRPAKGWVGGEHVTDGASSGPSPKVDEAPKVRGREISL